MVVLSLKVRFNVALPEPAYGNQYNILLPSSNVLKDALPVQAPVAAVWVPTISSVVPRASTSLKVKVVLLGSLIADNPELEDALERIGIEGVDDIEKACEEIDEKAEKNDDRENDDGYQKPSLGKQY